MAQRKGEVVEAVALAHALGEFGCDVPSEISGRREPAIGEFLPDAAGGTLEKIRRPSSHDLEIKREGFGLGHGKGVTACEEA